MFEDAKAKELAGLADRGVYEVVCREDIPVDANVLGGRFVLAIKNADTQKEVYKARFVVQGHTDTEKTFLFTTARTSAKVPFAFSLLSRQCSVSDSGLKTYLRLTCRAPRN